MHYYALTLLIVGEEVFKGLILRDAARDAVVARGEPGQLERELDSLNKSCSVVMERRYEN